MGEVCLVRHLLKWVNAEPFRLDGSALADERGWRCCWLIHAVRPRHRRPSDQFGFVLEAPTGPTAKSQPGLPG